MVRKADCFQFLLKPVEISFGEVFKCSGLFGLFGSGNPNWGLSKPELGAKPEPTSFFLPEPYLNMWVEKQKDGARAKITLGTDGFYVQRLEKGKYIIENYDFHCYFYPQEKSFEIIKVEHGEDEDREIRWRGRLFDASGSFLLNKRFFLSLETYHVRALERGDILEKEVNLCL